MYICSIEINRILESILVEDYKTLNSYLICEQNNISSLIGDCFGISESSLNSLKANENVCTFEHSLIVDELENLLNRIKICSQKLLTSKSDKDLNMKLGMYFKNNSTIIETYLLKLKNMELLDSVEVILNIIRSCFKMVLEYAKEKNIIRMIEKPKKCIQAHELLNSKFISNDEIKYIYHKRIMRDSELSLTCFELFYKFFDLVIANDNTQIVKYINSIICRVEDIMGISEFLVKKDIHIYI